jgi:hypothetical protein
MANNQAIQLDGILSNVQNTEVQVYSTSSIADVNEIYDISIESTLRFEDVPSLINQITFGTPQLNFTIYPNTLSTTSRFGNFGNNERVITFDPTLSNVANVELNEYSTDPIQVVSDSFDGSIYSTLAFGTIELVQPIRELIKLNATLLKVANTQLSEYSTVSIAAANDPLDDAIDSTLLFGLPKLSRSIKLGSIESLAQVVAPKINQEIDDAPFPSIESLLEFGLSQLNFKTYVNSIDSSLEFGNSRFRLFATAGTIESTSEVSSVRLNQNIDDAPFPSIDSTVEFGNAKINQFVVAESIQSDSTVSRPQVTSLIVPQPVVSTLQFGNSRLNQEITNIPNPEIQSTLVVPAPNVLKVIGPLGISSTENFGVSAFIDNIHRLLVFKDDNISKVGENDAVVIAGGIRMNPSSVVSDVAAPGNAVLPEAPVGFLSVNINGVDFKVPYYNS